jgi:hypothetical protein
MIIVIAKVPRRAARLPQPERLNHKAEVTQLRRERQEVPLLWRRATGRRWRGSDLVRAVAAVVRRLGAKKSGCRPTSLRQHWPVR